MIKEEIAIYQDPKNKKTTIVIYNMSQKTRDRLAMDLLGDLKVETVTGLTEVNHDVSNLDPDVTGMTPVTVTSPAPAAPVAPVTQPEPAKEVPNKPEPVSAPTPEPVQAGTTESLPFQADPSDLPPFATPEPQAEAPVVTTPVQAAPSQATNEELPPFATPETPVETTPVKEKKERKTKNPSGKRGRPRKDAATQTAEEEPITPVDATGAMNPPEAAEEKAPEEPTVESAEPAVVTPEVTASTEVTDEAPEVEAEVAHQQVVVAEMPEEMETSEMGQENTFCYTEMPEEMESPYMYNDQQEKADTNVYEDAPVINAREKVAELWKHYDENAPEAMLNEFIGVWQTGSQDEKVAAAAEVDRLMQIVAQTRRKIQSLLWNYQNFLPFTKALMSAIRQKGFGDGLVINTSDYMNALVNTLNSLSDEELVIVARGAAKNMLADLNPMFNIN